LPIAVHEQNARPGIANRLAARWTRHLGVTFPGTPLRHSRVVGLPLRAEIERLDRPVARAEGVAFFGLDPGKPVLLVTGGSTGALRLNRSVSESVAAILGAGWQVVHITGSRSPVEDPGLGGYLILEYCDRMDLALAVADLAVSRAGAATVCELAAVGVPAVFVPYAVGNGEQALNARGAVDAGGAVLVTDAAFTSRYVEHDLPQLLQNRARVADMAARMASVGVRDGADRMVDLVVDARASARR
ncbi:MAG TPA: glycosyltransferase, partial [Pseudolysinimonas sp.]|nr:glycosyltransferase [Pseudolysinimonas sp.]